MVIYQAKKLDLLFGALANPTRRGILDRLTRSDQSVLELASHFDMSQPAVTKHLNVLQRAGLIQRRKHGRYRYCSLQGEALESAESWIERTREYWEQSFAALDEYLQDTQPKEREP